MMKKYLLPLGSAAALLAGLIALTSTSPALAIDSFYVGGQVGQVALTGDTSTRYNNAIGFGIDLGVRTNPLLDVVLQVQRSGHPGPLTGLTLYSQTLSADFHFWEFNDFEFTLGGGPGFYFFNTQPRNDTNFGLNVGTNVDVIVDSHVRLGLGWRFHGIFSGAGDIGRSYWTAMMRVGYLFTTD